MLQSWKIFSRDFTRLARTTKAWIILVGILVMPALYSWVNISAFWDPYSETGNIAVAVVNEDRGATTEETGSVNVGKQVTEQLKDNHQIGWTFMNAAQAEEALNRGEVYASITIPGSFSEDLLSILTEEYRKPTLEYRVNEKRNAIAPIITDTASRELSNQITSAFKAQVASAVSEKLKDGGKELSTKIDEAQSKIRTSFKEASNNITQARSKLSELNTKLDTAKASVSEAQRTINQVEAAISDTQDALADVQKLTTSAQQDIANYTDITTSAFVEATSAAAEAASQARVSVADVTSILGKSGEQISAATDQVNVALKDTEDALTTAEKLLDSASLSAQSRQRLQERLDGVKAAHERNRTLINDLTDLRESAANTATTVDGLAADIEKATQTTKDSAQTLRTTVSSTVPQLNTALGELNFAAGSLSSALSGQQTTMQEARTLINGVVDQLSATQSVLSSFDSDLAAVLDGVNSVRHDLTTLDAASRSQVLATLSGLDVHSISDFFAHPVAVKSVPVFPVGTYGNAMTALFTNLSLWIGAFVLMVIFRLEVDLEGLKNVTLPQAYVGRLLLFMPIVIAQAITVTVGNLMLGVEAVHPIAYIATSIFTGLVYLNIIYALACALGHIGRGLAILIVILQIPGATGIYPIEMMPGFFRALYPVLPFSYGIEAMRETIGGYYGHHYAQYVGVLTLMGVLAFTSGIILRRAFAHVHVMVNGELDSTRLVASEPVHIAGTGYRFADLIRVLQGREGFAASIDQRSRAYLRRIQVVAAAGAIGLAGLSVVAARAPQQKVLFLGLWTAWAVIIFISIAALEYVRQSVVQSEELASLSDEELRAAIVARKVGALADEAPVPSVSEEADLPVPASREAEILLPEADEEDLAEEAPLPSAEESEESNDEETTDNDPEEEKEAGK